MKQDEEHLRLLSLFHYIVAGITGLFAMFPLLHLAMGIFFIYQSKHAKSQANTPPEFVGWVFVILAGIFIIFGLTLALLIFLNGRALAKRRNRTFCQVVAGIECVFMPFGTALGVFTIIVLSRDSVKSLFETGSVSGAPK